MNTASRHARLSALAKINLDLRVLGRRTDGYHDLRTVFQTVSLADSLDIEFNPAPETSIALRSSIDIEDNLVARAARLMMDAMKTTGRIEMRLVKRIPMGAGLGGGSSDAAAVLLALPVLAGRRVPLETLLAIGACLGSDVPFFLLGGTAVGLGRGTELYPLPERPSAWGLVVAPEIHVSTAEAYRMLNRPFLKELGQAEAPAPPNELGQAEAPALPNEPGRAEAPALPNEPGRAEAPALPNADMINSFQSFAWDGGEFSPEAPAAGRNDFEPVVFAKHPELQQLKEGLERSGAQPAMLSGSGSALFGLYRGRAEAERALRSLRNERAFLIAVVSRARYRALWWRRLGAHVAQKVWPPLSRYA
jgi:4-diphosphocytidyl-2-C-methyl-D-erythritol kinase